MAANISVPYTILMDSGIVEGISQSEGPYAIVKFKCLTADRYQLCADLVGTSVKVTGTTGTSIVRTYPFAYPLSTNLICRSIESIEQRGPGYPLIPNSVWVGRKWSVVTAKFGIATFFADAAADPSGQPFTTTTFDVAGEVLTLPNGTYKFSGGQPTGTPIGLTLPQLTISMKRWMLPYPPIGEMSALVGKVNNAPVFFADVSFGAGYLLFAGGPITITSNPVGDVLYEAEYRMIYRPYPWNWALNPNGTSGFQQVTDAGGNPPYLLGDFTLLP